MAQLSHEDNGALMGEDWKRKLDAGTEITEGSSPEEKRAAKKKRVQQLGDMQLSFGAVGFTGAALTSGALYTGQALLSVQSLTGFTAFAFATDGIIFATVRQRSVSAELAINP